MERIQRVRSGPFRVKVIVFLQERSSQDTHYDPRTNSLVRNTNPRLPEPRTPSESNTIVTYRCQGTVVRCRETR